MTPHVMGRLMKPNPKVDARILRAAVTEVARKEESNFVDVEDAHNIVRSALNSLLTYDDRPVVLCSQGGGSAILEAAKALVAKTEGIPSEEVQDLAQSIMRQIDDITKRHSKAARERIPPITCDQVTLYLKVALASKEAYLKEGYDPEAITASDVYALAQLVDANFGAYENLFKG
jgi:hypothetical protein